MDAKRFAWVVLIFSGGLMLLMLWAYKQRTDRNAGDKSPESTRQAAAQPAAQPTPATPPDAPTPPGLTAKVSASRPPSPNPGATPDRERSQWRYWSPRTSKNFTIGSLDPKGKYLFQVELNTKGAGVRALKLAKHFATVEDKQLAAKDPKRYETARREKPEKYRGHYSLLNAVEHGEATYLPFATREVGFRWSDTRAPFKVRVDDTSWILEPGSHTVGRDGTERIRFTWTLYRDANYDDSAKKPDLKPFLRLIKSYEVIPNSHSLRMSLEVVNLSGDQLKVEVDQAGPTGVPREDIRGDSRRAAYGRFRPDDQTVQVSSKSVKDLGKMTLTKQESIGSSNEEQAMLWLGCVNKFFGSMVYLLPGSSQAKTLAAPEYKADFYVSAVDQSSTSRTFLTGVRFPALNLAPGEAQKISFDVFAGPKLRGLFSEHDLYKKLNYVSTIALGACGCAWQPLTLGMMWLLEKFSWVSFRNYGVAIILLVILVRIVLHPLTKKSQVSMMKMQKLGPQVQKLKEKYADDKNTLNKEMMRLYKQGGATPLLGCLPMLLQMPILFALYTSLNATVDLRHAAFLPVWITDLAAPDALFKWSKPVWLIGNTFNLLPILLAVAMYFQTKLNPQMGQVASPQQEKSQNMMKVLMPVMMLVIFYNLASGVGLYFMTSTFAGVAEQYFIRKHIREREQREAAVETTVRVPGKGSRSSRPKKPKGPFWIKGK